MIEKMRNLMIFLALVVIVIIGQPSFAQTKHERKQLSWLEKEISRVEVEIKNLEKEFKINQAKKRSELTRRLQIVERQADPSFAKSVQELEAAIIEVPQIKEQINLVDKQMSTLEMELKYIELGELQEKRQEMLAGWIIPSNNMPREMNVITKNRRQRANVVRREELVLSKIETNLAVAVEPNSGEYSGYKVIFDNKYGLSTTFILRGLDGGEKLAVSISPRTKEVHHVLPGRYIVEYHVNGRRLEKTKTLTIDGQRHFYESEPCFGFVYMSRY